MADKNYYNDIENHDYNKVLYVEPNYNIEMYDRIKTVNYTHDLEDYCIYVDLMVEVYDREVSVRGQEGNTYFLFSWKTSSNGDTVSFMGGKRLKLKGTKDFHILTTDYLNTHFSDVLTDAENGECANSELFGIDSIEISYNNYAVPQVDIHFTDIKGVSLFAPEELRHRVSANGIQGMADNDIAGSFFKCFFTFPYPRFVLMVKGFYGEPVSYELSCYDFKAKFDSKTGNFGVDAKFVGYMFSILGDVSLNALISAPYSDYLGSDYWESQGGNNSQSNQMEIASPTDRFSVYNNNHVLVKMPTLSQIIGDVQQIAARTQELQETSEDVQKSAELKKTNDLYVGIKSKYDNFFDNITKNTDSNFIFLNNDKSAFLCLITEDENRKQKPETFLKLEDNTTLETLITNLNSDIKSSLDGSNTKTLPEIKVGNFIGELIVIDNNGETPTLLVNKNVKYSLGENKSLKEKVIKLITEKNEKNEVANFKNTYGYYFNATNFVNNLQNVIQENELEYKKVNDKVQEQQNQIIEDALGFSPTLFNINKILFAHLETFMHMMYTATNAVNLNNQTSNKRTIKDFKLPDVDLCGLQLNEDEVVPPWPKVATMTDSEKGYVDGWIGEYMTNGNIQPEAELVRGLVNGMNGVNKTITEWAEKEQERTANASFAKSYGRSKLHLNSFIKYPTCTYDFVFEGNPFGISSKEASDETFRKSMLTDTTKGIIYHMWVRMVGVLALDNKKSIDIDDYKCLGEADAINFYNIYKNDISSSAKKLFSEMSTDDIVSLMSKEGEWEDYGYKYGICNGKLPDIKKWIVTKNGDTSTYNESSFITQNIDDLHFLIKDRNDSKETFRANYNNKNKFPKNVVFYDDIHIFDNLKILTDTSYIKHKWIGPSYSGVCSNLIKNAAYSETDIYDSKQCFTNNYDGWGSSEYIYNGQTIGHKWKMSEENDNGVKGNINTNNANDGSGVIRRNKNDDGKSFPITTRNGYLYLDCNNVNYKRPDFNFDEFCTNIKNNNIDSYCIPTIQYYDKPYTLFASEKYYESNKRTRAFLFLDSLRLHDVRHLSEMFIDKSQHFIKATEVSCLLAGAYLWLKENERNYNGDDLYCTSQTFWDDDSDDLNPYVRERFIERFLLWVDDNSTSGFTHFENELALHDKEGKLYTVSKVQDFVNSLKKDSLTEKTFNLLINDTFRKNYMKVTRQGKLFIREDSEIMKELMKFNIKPLLIVKPFSNSISFDDYDTSVFKKHYKEYIEGFNEVLSEIFTNDVSVSEQEQYKSATEDPHTDENIEIGFYKYCKILHDKWLGSFNEDDWLLENFFDSHFHFIDAYYNNIGDKLMINPEHIVQVLVSSIQNQGTELVSFLGSIAQDTSTAFQVVQNFMNIKDTNYVSNMRKMFKPISYTDMSCPDSVPHFVFIHKGEASSHLPINGSEYKDDGFVLDYDNEKNWPKAILNKVEGEDSPIPAFGVTYGSQYQSYFTDISVGTEDGMVTEQSLQAQALIANLYSNKKEGTNVFCLGQDIYTNYATKSYECHVTMMGCAWIQPLMYFVLTNIPLFKGSYLIQKVTHSISPGNMITKFTGTRMANTSTPLLKSPYHSSDVSGEIANDINFGGGVSIANIENDCPYSIFSVGSASYSDVDMDKFTEQGGYDKYINYTKTLKDGTATPRYNTIAEAITKTAIKEAGWNDEIAIKLVICALYNRYIKNPNGTSIFVNKLTAYYLGGSINESDAKYNKIYNWVIDIFGGTPSNSNLVGKIAQVTSQPSNYIYVNNSITNDFTVSKTIELIDLQQIDGWCTAKIYNDLNVSGANHHRKQRYILRHDYPTQSGHIFISELKNNDDVYWKPKPIENSDDKNELLTLANDLTSAIQKSIDSTNSINCRITCNKFNADSFIITSDNKEDLGTVFDIMLNGYSKYISLITWLCKSFDDAFTNNYPTYGIQFYPTHDAEATTIKIGKLPNDKIINYLDNFSQNINDYFYKTLYKHYQPSLDVNIIKKDCSGFKNVNDETVINWLTKNKPSDCGSAVNSSSNRSNSTMPPIIARGNEVSPDSIVDRSGLVNNEKMQMVLKNVSTIKSKYYGNKFRKKKGKEPLVYQGEYFIQHNIYLGCCTSGPTTWYNRSGMDLDSDSWWNGNGKYGATFENSRSYLEGKGFKPVWNGTLQQIDDLKFSGKLRPGDIATLFTMCYRDGSYHQHAIMWDGVDWRSDAIQNNADCYQKRSKLGNKSAYIWRHPDYQDYDENHNLKPIDW